MRLKIFLLLATVVAILSCKGTTSKKALQLSQEQFYQVLFALHEKEGEFPLTDFQHDSITVGQKKIYDSIFQHHEVQEPIFQEEYETYLTHYSEELDSLYDRMLNELRAKKDSVVVSKKKTQKSINSKKSE